MNNLKPSFVVFSKAARSLHFWNQIVISVVKKTMKTKVK